MARIRPNKQVISSMAPSLLLLLVLVGRLSVAQAFSSTSTSPSTTMSAASSHQHQYPRPLHPGGFSLPPLVEDRLPIVATTSTTSDGGEATTNIKQTDILLVKPPDMESLWEWYAYTKRTSDCDPSWGRVWPTATSLARFVLRCLDDENENEIEMGSVSIIDIEDEDGSKSKEQKMLFLKRAVHALRTVSHAIEIGCGLGVAGLTYASCCSTTAEAATHSEKKNRKTITFLDREPYALHCVLASVSTNGLTTGPIVAPVESTQDSHDETNIPSVIARAAIDDWTLPMSNENNGNDSSPIKNVCYQDLHLNSPTNKNEYDNANTIILASDILYEPNSMESLASKLGSLLHPTNGGYALIADPLVERTSGCRDAFVKTVQELGGNIDIYLMPELDRNNVRVAGGLLESDIDIDGVSLAKTVLIVVHFDGNEENVD